mgnify:CR=1 FL=1
MEAKMDKQGRRQDSFHTIVCSACSRKAFVKKTRKFLCDKCFSGDTERVQWEVVNTALTNYLTKNGIKLLELVPHNKWKEG